MMKMPAMSMKWRYNASFFLSVCICSAAIFSSKTLQAVDTSRQFSPFEANYIVYRGGKKHGDATRYLTQQDGMYELGYSSNISWLVFKDRRSEISRFLVAEQQVTPLSYQMIRSGTGPSRHYELHLNQQEQQLFVGKEQRLKNDGWQADWLDPLSFHQQLAIDVKAGKTEFAYDVLNRHGNSKTYHYRVITEEPLALPYGTIRAIRIARINDNPKKQVLAWLAPELDYMLVRIWHGEDNVEQFDVQLHKLTLPETNPETETDML